MFEGKRRAVEREATARSLDKFTRLRLECIDLTKPGSEPAQHSRESENLPLPWKAMAATRPRQNEGNSHA